MGVPGSGADKQEEVSLTGIGAMTVIEVPGGDEGWQAGRESQQGADPVKRGPWLCDFMLHTHTHTQWRGACRKSICSSILGAQFPLHDMMRTVVPLISVQVSAEHHSPMSAVS